MKNNKKMASLCILLSLCYDDEYGRKGIYRPIPRDATLTPTGNPLDVPYDDRMKASSLDPIYDAIDKDHNDKLSLHKLEAAVYDGFLPRLFQGTLTYFEYTRLWDLYENYGIHASPAPDADAAEANKQDEFHALEAEPSPEPRSDHESYDNFERYGYESYDGLDIEQTLAYVDFLKSFFLKRSNKNDTSVIQQPNAILEELVVGSEASPTKYIFRVELESGLLEIRGSSYLCELFAFFFVSLLLFALLFGLLRLFNSKSFAARLFPCFCCRRVLSAELSSITVSSGHGQIVSKS